MVLSYTNVYTNVVVEGKNLKLVDAPVSGGVKRASMGELTVCKDLLPWRTLFKKKKIKIFVDHICNYGFF